MEVFEGTMLIPAMVAFFKYKVVRSILVLACWSPHEQIKLIRELSSHGLPATFACSPAALGNIHMYGLQGVVYFKHSDDSLLTKTESEHFSGRYIWLVVEDEVPAVLNKVRYDAEITLLQNDFSSNKTNAGSSLYTIHLKDIYVHPGDGASVHPWAYWCQATGLYVPQRHERERIQRRFDFRGHPLRITAPLGLYADGWYNGTFQEYITDETLTDLDAGIRSGSAASVLVIQSLNATETTTTVELWGTTIHNDSMLLKLKYGEAELSGGILRMLPNRLDMLDYVTPIWPFHVGFSYLAERQSSSNMFVDPFTAGVWWSCLGIGLILAFALRATATKQDEKDDAFCTVLATCLQQDASAVPQGLSGRWTFTVLSVCAMLVHAYYTSAIVSALMSTGSGGPDSLRSLADSKYAIASEDYTYMRYLFFDVETTWEDLEYLKRKKKTSKFYQELERGAELVREGNTAFHTEYNQIYSYFKSFTDDQICKLQHVDTIPEVMTYITTTYNGQFTNTFRTAGTKILETGLQKRMVAKLQAQRPPCRVQMLAERVKFGDVAPLMSLTAFGAFLSLFILGLEILCARLRGKEINDKDTDSIVAFEEHT